MMVIKFLIFGVILALAGIFFVLLAGSEGFGGIFGLILVICGVISGIFGLLCSDGNPKASAVDDAEKSIQPDSSNESTPDNEK